MKRTIGAGGKTKKRGGLDHDTVIARRHQPATPIDSDERLAEALAELAEHDTSLAPLITDLAPLPLRKQSADFAGLVRIVTGQQVSRASAEAIWGRLITIHPTLNPAAVLKGAEPPLVEAGLSRPKQKTVLSLAQACRNGFDPAATATLPPEDAMATLTALHGIGPWSAQVFLLFCSGHRDIFPAGDIALQHAVADHLTLPERPTAKDLATIAERWQPHRSAAARLFYAHYARLRQGALPV